MSAPLEPAPAFSPGPLEVEECGFDGSAALAALDQPQQILVFQTLQEALIASPPRPEATFARVVKAYTTLAKVVASAADGRLLDAELCRLQHDIEAAGGDIAPGLKSTGVGSLAEFRAATFGLLDQGYDEAVIVAIYAALNARLKARGIDEIDGVFEVVTDFFADLSPSVDNLQAIQSFGGLDVVRQVLVFESMRAGVLSQPPRQDATFANLVAAYCAERDVLLSAQRGELDDIYLAHLENCLVAAGGVIEPGIWAHGRSSVAAFRAETFRVLQQLLPVDVLNAAIKSLNVGLRGSSPVSILQVFSLAKAFLSPLLNENWDSQTMRSFRALSLRHQTLVFETVEISLRHNPGLESSIFSSAVRAIAQERFVVDAAGNGALTPGMILDLREAIERCGGEIAPGIRSEGTGSISEFCDQCFVRTARVMSKNVYDAALAALNAALKTSSIQSIEDVMRVVTGFTAPFSLVQPARNLTDAVQDPESKSSANGETLDVDLLDGDRSLTESVDSDLHDVCLDADRELSLVAEGWGDGANAGSSDTQAEKARVSVDSEGGAISSWVDSESEGSSYEQESLSAPADLPPYELESQTGVRHPSAYPIFSLNTPAVSQQPVEASMGAVSGDDQEEGDDILIKA